ncbi:type II toxin-antitoxin system RelE/ParE family toxin [Corynebacterium sp. J010B-136]|uniref:type II toxin-antitoxin system RelE family toxin n=1 Tax=Corynebacterium sp. J010B-136 TaxID=2099401 RepID=UPI000CFA59AC|nr:type II toxin-antitoxin system RelE/ParE family toxin [Corynebacterium sp. J010B-136]PQM75670.1 type II toxin-antitoxin system mRNA interferase toxin, RelE/StbE family [Corynebacterium sp. J010B-136]
MSESKYSVSFRTAAIKSLRKLENSQRVKLIDAIEGLADDPRPVGVKKLQGGSGEYRIRVGSYRVIYEIQDKQLIILVLNVGHRREIYR